MFKCMSYTLLFLYGCTQSVYVIVMFINGHYFNFTLDIFLSSLFRYFYKVLHNSFRQFISHLAISVLQYFVETQMFYSWCPHTFECPHPWALSSTWANSQCSSIHKPLRRCRIMTFEKSTIVRLLTNA